MDKPFDVILNKAERTAEILIYGDVGGFDWNTWEEINTAKQFRSEFKALENDADVINVCINSVGGSVHEGLAIANVIQQSTKEVHTWIDGVAMSMAAIIALAAPKGRVHMAKNGLLMIHNAWTISLGNADQLRTAADVLDKYDRSLILQLAERTGMSEDEIRSEWMNYKDHYFTSDEALEAGLIDHVESYEAPSIPDVSDMKAKGYMKVAASANNRKEQRESILAIIRNRANQPTPEPMNMERMKAYLASEDCTLSAEDKAALTAEVDAALAKGPVITQSDLDAVNAAKDAAEAKASEFEGVVEALEGIEGDTPSAKISNLKAELQAAKQSPAPVNVPIPGEDDPEADDPIANSPMTKWAKERMNS